MGLRLKHAAALLVVLSAGRAVLATNWNEGVNGNLSTNPASPTAVTLTSGDNLVTGNVDGTNGDSQDWVAITVPTGFVLSSDTLTAYDSTDTQGFTGFQVGSSFPGSAFAPASYAGYAHFGPGATNPSVPISVVGSDLLPLMADSTVSAGATGFTDPLAAGTYTFLIQQLGSSTSYTFNFGVSMVAATPEPGTIGVLGIMGIAALLRRRTRVA